MGELKLVFAPDDQRLLGVHLVGENASELIHIGTACMQFGWTLDYFIQAVFNVNLNRLETSMACSKATTPRGALRGHPESRLTPPS